MTALLSQALVAFAIDYESRRGGPIQWGANILRTLGDDGAGLPPLPASGTHSVKNLVRLGIITKGDGAVRPSATGRAMRDAYQPLCEQIESQGRQRFGSTLVDEVDEVVEAVEVVGKWRPFPLVVWTAPSSHCSRSAAYRACSFMARAGLSASWRTSIESPTIGGSSSGEVNILFDRTGQ